MRSSFWAGLMWIGMPLCAAGPASVPEAARRFLDVSAKVPPPLAVQFRVMAAKALQPHHAVLAQSMMPSGTAIPAPLARREDPAISAAEAAVYQQFGRFGEVAGEADRARLILDLASQVRALPAGAAKLDLARSVCGSVTEGDVGPRAIAAVAEMLAESIQGAPPDVNAFLDLANLVHYEHVPPPMQNPALDAALALLELRESLVQEAQFSLAALDGRIYSLAALRGKIVLVNFWATSCMPCRKEMPEIEKLYRVFADQGLIVLAISTEERGTVATFIAEHGYSFPVLLDSDGKASADFGVDGIPKSFLFDHQGRLVAEAIDRRSEPQFRSMLKTAGLK